VLPRARRNAALSGCPGCWIVSAKFVSAERKRTLLTQSPMSLGVRKVRFRTLAHPPAGHEPPRGMAPHVPALPRVRTPQGVGPVPQPIPEPVNPSDLVTLALGVVKADRFPNLATVDDGQPRVRPVSPVRTDGFTVYVANLRS